MPEVHILVSEHKEVTGSNFVRNYQWEKKVKHDGLPSSPWNITDGLFAVGELHSAVKVFDHQGSVMERGRK